MHTNTDLSYRTAPPRQFLTWIESTYGDDADKIDIEGEYDSTLTIDENKHHFLKNFGATAESLARRATQPTEEDIARLEEDHAATNAPASQDAPISDMVRGAKTISISGGTGSGKTALAYRCLDALSAQGKQAYIYKHPNPRILPSHIKNLYSLADLEDLRDCAVYIDEPSISMPRSDHHAGTALMNLLGLCRQLNITLIISTSDSRYITRSIEAYVDVYMVKDQEAEMAKRGSMILKIIRDNVFIDPSGFKLSPDQFLYHARNRRELSGRHRFALPSYWTEAHSTPYRGV